MMGLQQTPAAALAVSLDEVKTYLRIEHAHEDGLIAGMIRSATALCEAFTGQALITRGARETLRLSAEWRRLSLTPVRSIDAVVDGGGAALAASSYAIDVDGAGDGWLRLPSAVSEQIVTVIFEAGGADDWNGVPEPLRQGITRLVAHMHLHRDGAGEASPPAAVAALWRPFRRMRLK